MLSVAFPSLTLAMVLAVPVPDPGLLEQDVSLDLISNPGVGEGLDVNLLEKASLDPAASRSGKLLNG